MQAANSVHACSHNICDGSRRRAYVLYNLNEWWVRELLVFSSPFAADEEFDELCFDFGIELDEVVR